MRLTIAAVLLIAAGCSAPRSNYPSRFEPSRLFDEIMSVAISAQAYRADVGAWPNAVSELDGLQLVDLRVTALEPQPDGTLRAVIASDPGGAGVLHVYPSDSTAVEFSTLGASLTGTVRVTPTRLTASRPISIGEHGGVLIGLMSASRRSSGARLIAFGFFGPHPRGDSATSQPSTSLSQLTSTIDTPAFRTKAAVSTAESTTSHRARSSKASASRRKSTSARPVSARRRRAVAREQGGRAEARSPSRAPPARRRGSAAVGHLDALVPRPLAKGQLRVEVVDEAEGDHHVVEPER